MTTYTASLVATTIFDPVALDAYFDNFRRFGRLDQVGVYLIPDRKTPEEAYGRCEALRRRGMKVACPGLEEQEAYLRRVGFPAHLVPWNSDNRRNVGYLMALESGTDFVISIDDDNHCRPDEDFLGEHSVVCAPPHTAEVVNTSTGWYNVCSQLHLDREGTTYARGFPYHARHRQEAVTFARAEVDVQMNAGLWLLDPDVDAITWMVAPAHSVGFSGRSVVLGPQAWSPINTQNTAMRREVVTSYYYLRMGYPLGGLPIDRYGDIFSGYFAQACVRHLGGSVRVGTPVADHKRNSHNYVKDAQNEWGGLVVLEDVLPWLTELKLEGSTYAETYRCLSHAIEDAVERFQGGIWTDATRAYFHQMAYCMRRWVDVCERL